MIKTERKFEQTYENHEDTQTPDQKTGHNAKKKINEPGKKDTNRQVNEKNQNKIRIKIKLRKCYLKNGVKR